MLIQMFVLLKAAGDRFLWMGFRRLVFISAKRAVTWKFKMFSRIMIATNLRQWLHQVQTVISLLFQC